MISTYTSLDILLEQVVWTMLSKRSSLPGICLRNSGSLKALNDSTLILNESEWPPWSFKINLESFRTFRGSLFLKEIIGIKFLFGTTVHITGSSKIGATKLVNLYQEKQWKIGNRCFLITLSWKFWGLLILSTWFCLWLANI